MSDVITRPEHYTSHPSGIEPIQITRHETFLRGNILKYVFRAPYKGTELQDLKKAKMYLEWEIERVENDAHSKYIAKGSSVQELYDQLGTMPDTVELESYDFDWNDRGRLVITLRFADFD